MAYSNNYYVPQAVAGYGTSTPIYNGPVYQTPVNNNSGIFWVTGEEQARNFPVSPGGNLLLMDVNKLVLYSKSVDARGSSTLEIYDLVKRETPSPAEGVAQSDFVKRDELEALVASAVSKAMRFKKGNPHKQAEKEVEKNE